MSVNIGDISLADDDRPQFEKFDLGKNEQARINIPSTGVEIHYVHVFHNDTPEMVERNGRMKPEWSRESYAGSFICSGDQKVVSKNNRYGDPANCPACRAMHQQGPNLVEFPKRNYAMNVIRYSTRNNDNMKLRNKNVEVQLWKHGDDKKIGPIITASKQVKGKIETLDFLVSDDEGSDWKKWNIQPAIGGALHSKDAELGQNYEEAKADLHDDATLVRAIGKKLSSEELEAEVTMLYNQYGAATGGPTANSLTPGDTEEDNGIVIGGDDEDDFSDLEDVDVEGLAGLLDD